MFYLLISLLLLANAVGPSYAISRCDKTFFTGLNTKIAPYKNMWGNNGLRLFEQKTLPGRGLNVIASVFRRPLKLGKISDSLIKLRKIEGPEGIFTKFAKAFDMKPLVSKKWLESIPKKGPLIFFANHPLSGMEGIAIAAALEEVRPDIKVIANEMVKGFGPIGPRILGLRVMGRKEAGRNAQNLEAIYEHLKSGNSLVIFPSGRLSAWQPPFNRTIAVDDRWRKGLIRMIKEVPEATLYPVFVAEEPSKEYLKMYEFNETLSFAFVLREVARVIGKPVSLIGGEAISPLKIAHLNMEDQISYLRGKNYELGTQYFFGKYSKENLPLWPEASEKNPLLTRREQELVDSIDKN